jgi:hypothetical protein
LAHQQERLYESVPLLEVHAAEILEAAQQAGLKVGDITEPLNSKTFRPGRTRQGSAQDQRPHIRRILPDFSDQEPFF